MKTFLNIMKVVAVLAAIAGVIYIIATYGDRIVEKARKLLNRKQDICFSDEDCEANDIDFA